MAEHSHTHNRLGRVQEARALLDRDPTLAQVTVRPHTSMLHDVKKEADVCMSLLPSHSAHPTVIGRSTSLTHSCIICVCLQARDSESLEMTGLMLACEVRSQSFFPFRPLHTMGAWWLQSTHECVRAIPSLYPSTKHPTGGPSSSSALAHAAGGAGGSRGRERLQRFAAGVFGRAA